MERLEKNLYTGVKWVTILLFLGMVLLCALQVICRYVLKVSLSFTEELARYLFIWTTFLGSAMAVTKNKHVSMDLLVDAFPEKIGSLIHKAVAFFLAIMYLVLIYSGIRVMQKTMDQTSPAMNTPMGLVYMAVPVSMAIMIIFQIGGYLGRKEKNL